MANEFLARVGVEIDDSGVDAFVSQITAALSEISSKAEAAERTGGSRSGLTAGVRGLAEQTGAGLSHVSPPEQQRAMSQLLPLFDELASSLKRFSNFKLDPENLKRTMEQSMLHEARRERDRAQSSGGGQQLVPGIGLVVPDRTITAQARAVEGAKQRAAAAEQARQQAASAAKTPSPVSGSGIAIAEGTALERKKAAESASARLKAAPGSVDSKFASDQADIRTNNAVGSRSLANSPGYQTANAEAEKENQRNVAAKSRALADPANGYAPAAADASVALKEQQAAEARALADSDYARVTTDAAAAQKTVAVQVARAEADNVELSTATLALATERKLQQASEAELQATNQDYVSAAVLAATSLKRQAAVLLNEEAGDADYVAATTQAIEARKAVAAVEAEAAATEKSVASDTRARLSKNRSSTAVQTGVFAGTTEGDLAARGANAATGDRQRVAQSLQQYAQVTDQDRQASAELIVAKQEEAAKIKELVRSLGGEVAGDQKLREGAGQLGLHGPGTRFQRLQGFARSRRGGDTSSVSNLDFQTVGEKATKELGYALPGLAIGATIFELQSAIKEAELAQEAFAQLGAQFQALGQTSQLSGFVASIKQISDNTGLAISEVTDLGIAMKGVYGSTAEATVALKGISQAAVALDLKPLQAQQDTIALSQAFPELKKQRGNSATTISNEVLHLQDLTGVLGSGILAGAADLAPTGSQLGLSFKQTASLVAATAQHTGVSAADVSNNLSRILPSFLTNDSTLGTYLQKNPATAKDHAAYVNDIASGKSGDAFNLFLRDLPKFKRSEQADIANQLGGIKYAPFLLAAAGNASKYDALSQSAAPADRTAQEFAKQMATLKGTFERLKTEAQNLGVSLIDGPLGTGLKAAANLIGQLAHILTSLSDATNGFSTELIAVGGAILAFKSISSVTGTINALKASILELGGASEAAAGKEAADAAAIGAQGSASAVGGLGSAASGLGRVGADGLLVAESGGLRGGLNGIAGKIPKVGSALAGTVGEASLGATALGVGVAGLAGYQIGTAIFQHNKNSVPIQATEHFLTDHLFGQGTPVSQAKTSAGILHYFNTDPRFKLLRQKLTGAATPEQQSRIASLTAKDGNNADYLKLQTLLQQIEKSPAGKAALGDVNTAFPLPKPPPPPPPALVQQQQAASLNSIAKGDVSLSDQQTFYQAGALHQSDYLKSLNQQISDLTKEAPADPTKQAALAQALSQKSSLLAQLATQAQQFAQSLRQQGTASADTANIASLTALLNDPTFTDVSSRNQTAVAIIGDYQQKVADLIANAGTGAQKLALQLGGVQVSPADRASLLTTDVGKKALGNSNVVKPAAPTNDQAIALLNTDAQAAGALAVAAGRADPLAAAIAHQAEARVELANALAHGGSDTNAYKTSLAKFQTSNQTVIDQQNAVTAAQDALRAAIVAKDPLASALASHRTALDAQTAAATHGPAAQAAAQAQVVKSNQDAIEAQNAIVAAQDALLSATAAKNPRQAAADAHKAALDALSAAQTHGQAAQDQARAQVVASLQQGVDAQNAVVAGQDAVLTATVSQDPLAAAQAAQKTAADAQAAAIGTAAKLQAQAQQISADTSFQTALNDLNNSKLALLSAEQGASGAPIAQSQTNLQIAIQKAQQIAALDRSHGVNPNSDSNYQNALAAVATAQGQVVDTTVQTTISNTQAYLSLGKETANQAIAGLVALLPKVQGNQQETLTILQQIRSIQNTAGANLNFDLPTNLLTGPTLYTARRVEANANAGATGYQDNRQVSIQINMTPGDPSSTSAAVQAVLNAAGGPARSGSTNPILPR